MINLGNPNIKEQKPWEKSTGPKSKVGKLIISSNSLKSGASIKSESTIAKASGWDNSNIKESLKNYHSFVDWALNRNHPTKELTEIARLEGLMQVLEASLSRILDKLEKGEGTSDKDRKDMFLMKDTIVAIHEMKYGKKQTNINASYKDIRDRMFPDDN